MRRQSGASLSYRRSPANGARSHRHTSDFIPSTAPGGLSCSLQQKSTADDVALHRAVRLAVEAELRAAAGDLPGFSATVPEQLTVNGAGAFEVGGPEGDNGLSGAYSGNTWTLIPATLGQHSG